MSKLLRLSNGLLMPNHALGTSNLPQIPSELKPVLSGALQAGFKHIDTVGSYGVEPAIGQRLDELGANRGDLWLTSKVWPVWYRRIKDQCMTTLSELRTGYLDLFLLHWPVALKSQDPANPDNFIEGNPCEADDISLQEAWRQMEELVDEGYGKSIGVSNWTVPLLLDLCSYARYKPVVN